MDAKRLSTKKSCKRSKEFDGALEALVLNKDLLLEFLQKSNHFPTKDSTDISCSPFSAVNRITVLKPSRRNKFVDADVIYPSEDTKRCCRAPKGVKHSPTNPCANHSSLLKRTLVLSDRNFQGQASRKGLTHTVLLLALSS
jgi:hypothetical protein